MSPGRVRYLGALHEATGGIRATSARASDDATYSPAALGKAYEAVMGIQPILKRQPDFPKEVLGYAMAAYYGGRAEARIRKTPVPVVYLDFLSMYPTVCCLLGIWSLLTCERIEVVDAAATTKEVQELLAAVTPELCLHPTTWRQFIGLVQLAPEDEILPVRTRYGGEATWQIGVNRMRANQPLWYTIPHAVAATLLSGKPLQVIRAVRLAPQGANTDLRPVRLRGEILVDPCTQDFFKAVIEEGKRVERREDLSEEKRQRTSAFLKVLANATSYGIYAQMDRHELPKDERATVEVFGNDDEPFETRVATPEEPCPYCFPPIAACIAGAARLMLALLERAVTDRGGSYAMCDTDSMAIVATETGGLMLCEGCPLYIAGRKRVAAVKALSWAEVEEIRTRFAALNPYNSAVISGSILKIEKKNFDADGRQRQLWCYAVSAKRYTLFTRDETVRPTLVKVSEHGLGHLLNPTDPESDDRRRLWEGIVTEALGQPFKWPDWLERPAIGRITSQHSGVAASLRPAEPREAVLRAG